MMISVVMSVYNERIRDLNKSIDSVLRQTLSDFEFIIICDNPNSIEIRNFLLNKAKSDSRIKIIFNKVNIKQNLSRNKAIKKASSNFIAIMDADDVMDDNRLKHQYAFIKANNLDICFTNVSIINDFGEVTRNNVFGKHDIIDQNTIKAVLSSHSIALGPTFMFKKDVFTSLGSYTDMNVEDYDLVSKFLVDKKRLGYISTSLVYKRLRDDSISFNSLYEQFVIMKSISKYLKKYNSTKFVPYDYILENINNITERQLYSYKKYSEARYKFNDNRNIKMFLLVIYRMISSKTVLLHFLWSIKNKIIDKIYVD